MATMLGNPRPSLASYALYQADRAEWDRRTDNGAKKLSSDLELVKQANERFADYDKMVYERNKAYYSKKPPKKCIGNTASVTPLLENACVVIQEGVTSQREFDVVGNSVLPGRS